MRIIVAVIGFGLAATAQAQSAPAPAPAAPDCSLARPALPPVLAGWSSPIARDAAASAGGSKEVALIPGQAARLRLLATSKVSYAVTTGKPGSTDSFGGIVSFTVSAPGTYRVALGTGAWVDVVGGGKSLASTAHGHGPACSGIQKIVDFDLVAGTYLVQIAGSSDPAVTAMVLAAR